MPITLLLDGDILLYRACFACETSGGDYKDYIKGYIGHIKKALNTRRLLIALSGKHNFRKDILPAYKEPRKDQPKPKHLSEAKKFVVDNWKTKTVENIEADDVLGILSTWPGLKGEKVIFSIDKDFEQIPGNLINPNKDSIGEGSNTRYIVRTISADEANYCFYKQVLMGDRIDNYMGIPGIGPKKAEKILGEVGQSDKELWDKVVAAYTENDLTEEDAVIQAQCARLLRTGEYDFKTKEIKLWQPPE